MAVAVSGVQAAVARNIGNMAGKVSGDGSFASMISASMSKQASGRDGAVPAPQTVPVKQGNQLAAGKDGTDALPSAQVPEDGKPVAPEVQETGEPATDVDLEETGDAINEAVREVLEGIRDVLRDVLELDDEELGILMGQMGITMVDFLNPQVLQQFVVQAAGEENVSALLVDETLSVQFKQLLDKVQQVVDESGLSKEAILQQVQEAPEDFSQVLQQVQQAPEETVAPEQAVARQLVKQGDVFKAKPDTKEAPGETEGATRVSGGTKEGSFQFEAVREGETSTGREGSQERRGSSSDIKPAEQFLNLVSNAISETNEEAKLVFSQLSPAEQIREIADQILEKVRILVNPSQTSMELTLNPESLGKVSLNLIAKEGVMTAHFTAQTQVAREAIESQMVVLRENLEGQGLKVDAIEVTVSNFEFTQSDGTNSQEGQGGKPQQRRNITLEEADFLEEVTDEEAMAIDILARSGNQVDYTA